MARNIRVTDVNLYHAMKRTMMRSIRQSVFMKKFATEKNVPIKFHGRGTNDPVNYCMICEEEVRTYQKNKITSYLIRDGAENVIILVPPPPFELGGHIFLSGRSLPPPTPLVAGPLKKISFCFVLFFCGFVNKKKI